MSILNDISIEDYHAAPDVSASKLTTYRELGARGYWLRHVHASKPQARKTCFDVGNAFEDALRGAEPLWLPEPPADLKRAKNGALSTAEAKAWKAERDAWVDEQRAAGHVVLDPSEVDRELFTYGIQHLRENRTAMALIEASQEQQTIRAPMPGTGQSGAVPGIQARPDWLSLTGCAESDWAPVAPDLKTTTNFAEFYREVRRRGYHRQAGMVDLCLIADDVVGVRHPLIVVEKTFPYRCQVMWLGAGHLRDGAYECRQSLAQLAEHYEADEWPTVTEDEITLEPRPWERSQTDDDEGSE